jgi:hypothetical protein
MVRSGLGALLLALLTPAALDAQSFSEGGFVPQPAVAEALDDRPSVSELQGLTIFSNRAAFLSAFPHLTLEDFEGLNVANNAVCSGAAPLSSTTNDTCATPGTVAAGFELDTSPRTLYATLGPSTTYLNTSKVAGPNTYANDLVLRFTRRSSSQASTSRAPLARFHRSASRSTWPADCIREQPSTVPAFRM